MGSTSDGDVAHKPRKTNPHELVRWLYEYIAYKRYIYLKNPIHFNYKIRQLHAIDWLPYPVSFGFEVTSTQAMTAVTYV